MESKRILSTKTTALWCVPYSIPETKVNMSKSWRMSETRVARMGTQRSMIASSRAREIRGATVTGPFYSQYTSKICGFGKHFNALLSISKVSIQVFNMSMTTFISVTRRRDIKMRPKMWFVHFVECGRKGVVADSIACQGLSVTHPHSA